MVLRDIDASPAAALLMMERSQSIWQTLISEHQGSLALAAHAVAVLRLRARSTSTQPIPSPAELWAAAQDVAAKVAWLSSIPTPLALAAECQRAGREVLL